MPEHLSRLPGSTIWLTGLPAAGKSTLAVALRTHIGRRATVLDGDELRQTVSADLGFDTVSRIEQTRRVGILALDAARADGIALVALVSPYRQARLAVREAHTHAGVPFLEVWVATPLTVCRQRDPKGIYARAARGGLGGLTGVDDPYQPPHQPDVIVDHTNSAEVAAHQILARLLDGTGEDGAGTRPTDDTADREQT